MKKVFAAIFLLLSFYTYSQNNKEHFKKIFDDDLNEESDLQRSSHSGIYHYTTAQKVPGWFVNPPVSDGNVIYAIGISDPAMDTTDAMELALLRAEIMANLLRKSTTQLLCDFFMNEEDQSNSVVFEHYTRLSTKLPTTEGNYELVNSFRNNYDETIVLIKYTAPKSVSPENLQSVKLEMYKNETESSIYGVFESVYEMKVVSNSTLKTNPVFYELTELGDRSAVVSKFYDAEIKVPIYTLDYMGIPSKDSTNHCYLTHGLWKDYFKSVMLHIIGRAREKPENISHLSDKYNVESYQKLTRGVSVNKMRFVLNGFYVENGKFKAKMTELDL